MIETALRGAVRRNPLAPVDRSGMLLGGVMRPDRETETSASLAATPPVARDDAIVIGEPGTPQFRTDADVVVHDICARVAERLPGRIHDLRVEAAAGKTLVLSGVASSFYVKQLAQHIAMDVARLLRVINQIEVRAPR